MELISLTLYGLQTVLALSIFFEDTDKHALIFRYERALNHFTWLGLGGCNIISNLSLIVNQNKVLLTISIRATAS